MAAIVLQPDGKILVANGGYPVRGRLGIVKPATGEFGLLPGGIFRFNPDGSLDYGFASRIGPASACDGFHTWIVLQADGRLLAQGERGELVRLLPDGRLDDSLSIESSTNEVPALCVDPDALRSFAAWVDGSLVVAGKGPDQPMGNPYSVVRRFSNTGQWLGASQPAATPALIGAITRSGFALRTPARRSLPDGRPWGGGPLRSNAHLVRVTSDGPVRVATSVPVPLEEQFAQTGAADAVRALFRELPMQLCRCAVRLPDGGAVVAVAEPSDQVPSSRGRLVRFDSQWHVDWTYTNRFELRGPSGMSLAVDSRGRLLVAGNFATLNGESFAGVARLLPDGTTDQSFKVSIAGPFFPPVAALAVDADDRVRMGGYFEQVNRTDCAHLARLNVDGSLDAAFQSRFDRARFWNTRLSLATKAPRPSSVGASAGAGATTQASSTESRADIAGTIVIQRLETQGTSVEIKFISSPGRTCVLEAREA